MTPEQFVKFLHNVQKVKQFPPFFSLILFSQEPKADVAFAKKVISEFEKKEHGKDPTTLSVTGNL